jgi:hypothetical protein
LALPIFAITLFVSAFLLFLVQPMIGKLILPKLGGTPQVWNTCMVFFQSVLLLGYAYTHSVSTKLKLRQQLMLHCGLLVVPVVMMMLLPFYTTIHEWTPTAEGNPIPATLLLLAIVVGIPFFVVSTSAPLLQRWFAYSGDKAAKDPYFLYAASNLGSLLSLLFYPAALEPWTALPVQSTTWLVGYIALAGMIMYCAFMIHKVAPPDSVLAAQAELAAAPPPPEPALEAAALPLSPAPVPAPSAATAVKAGPGPGGGRSSQRKKGMKVPASPMEEKITIKAPLAPGIATGATAEMTNWRRIRWVLLAAVPSSLMLGVTSYISTDLSPFPLVWIVPLALYLLSFILVYMKVWTGRRYQIFGGAGYTLHDIVVYVIQPLGIIVLCFVILSHKFDPFWVTALLMFGFFANALACHGELAHDRPATKYLTEYYLMMSIGGMLGGLFNAIIAPLVFTTGVWEFHIAIVVACLVRPQYVPSGWFDELVLNAFPGLQTWFRNQGDEMAKSMGRPAPRSTYLFSLFLDVVFGVFILSISYWLASTFNARGNLSAVVKFLQVPQSDAWARGVFQLFVYFIPLVFCFFFAGRPLRFSLAVGALLLGNMYLAERDERRVLEARRTYFGLLRVQMDEEFVRDEKENEMFRKIPLKTKDGTLVCPPYPYTFLMHGTTYHGRNYIRNYKGDDYEKNRIDLSRLATTYYHRYGPVGIVMEQYNWFSRPSAPRETHDLLAPPGSKPGRQNDYTADLRMPASLLGQMSASLGVGQLPLAALVDTWSEPPLATIGLGTGTMASYSRPYGSMTYYEIDEVIRHFNLPEDGGEARFTFLQNSIRRGVNLEVLMGDARQSLETKREPKNKDNSYVFQGNFSKFKGGDDYPYADAPYNHEPDKQMKSITPDRNNYYKVIVVDAFSSDAIPVHLVTREAIQLYLDKLTVDGVLCVHTSNRHMDLVRPVARIAMALSEESKKKGAEKADSMTFKDAKEREEFLKDFEINCIVGKDGSKERFMGHFSSEYVMIFRGDRFTKHLDNLAAKKKEFVGNYAKAKEGGDDGLQKMRAAGKLMMRAEGDAPDGWQILNSGVEWYDPYTDHTEFRNGRMVKVPITVRDSIWTDDYTSILGLLR